MNLCHVGDIILHKEKRMEVAEVICQGHLGEKRSNGGRGPGMKAVISAYPIMTDNGQVLRRNPRYIGEDWIFVKKTNNDKVWSGKHACCIVCGTTKRKHSGHGMCGRCYKRVFPHS